MGMLFIRTLCVISLILLARIGRALEEGEVRVPVPTSVETEECLNCHGSITPGIVSDWRGSRHAMTTPEAALQKPPIERRISAADVPEAHRGVVVGCFECHGQDPAAHPDAFDHFGYRVHVVVSPNDCKTCHPVEAGQYAGSKKAHAFENLDHNTLFMALIEAASGNLAVEGNRAVHIPPSESTVNETCYGCHGSRVAVMGTKVVATDIGEVEIPDLSNWPNQGVGRINPDGSLGSCAACHPRHGFSIEVAREPYTCMQCHLEPDVPAWNVYQESKHGNIFLSQGDGWNWDRVPWRVGLDFRAPTCATCHNSLLTTPDGGVIAERTHDFGARLWVRIFGLIYSHPQPKDGRTYTIQNADGLPLPTTFSGELASGDLIGGEEQERRRGAMERICRSCHASDWVEGHFARMDATIAETDRMTRSATELLTLAWDKGIADRSNPFDEVIERKWVEQWLFYANSIRYASAMSGPDYATFKNGWWQSNRILREMREWLEEH